MPLLAGTKLAPNFTAHELGADKPEADATVIANLRRVAEWLQIVRGILMVPLRVTSGFRTPLGNTEAGGAADSDHVKGLAADFVAVGLTPFEVYQRLTKAQELQQVPTFDQLIYYVVDNHVHVGLDGARQRGEILLRTTEGTYVQLAGSYVTRIRGYL